MENKKVSFWRIFWPSLIAGIVLILLGFMFFTTVIGSLVNSSTPSYTVEDNTVLHLKLDKEIAEINTGEFEIDYTGLGVRSKIGLADLLYGFEKAAEDERVKGVFIELSGAMCGYATASEIRQAIKDFQEESGKFVIAYHSGEAITLKEYYIASAAKENYGFHSSNVEFLGLGTELMFFKGLFDKIDLEMQVVRGSNNDFKSAVEPYYLSEMSDSSRLQTETYLNGIWEVIRTDIGADRNISIETLNSLAEESKVRRVLQAVDHKLMDATKYRDEVMQLLADKSGVNDIEKLNLKSFEKYAEKKFQHQQNVANAKKANIAVIIAEGAIAVDGDGISSKKLTKLIKEAREDKDIKTIVLRVNSPGGSALASDEIWREIQLADQEKSVIVSMGDVAASGGYYIASPARRIFAERNTITGSIGVFGVIPNVGGVLENHLGLTFDRIGTNKHATSLTLTKKLEEDEFALIQDEVDYIYDEFLGRVAEGRGMSKEAVNVVARGRVWTGTDALRIGLVDEIGGINDAIAYAAKEAEIETPLVRYYPKVEKEAWMEMIESIAEGKGNSALPQSRLMQEANTAFKHLKEIEGMTGIQARMPYYINW